MKTWQRTVGSMALALTLSSMPAAAAPTGANPVLNYQGPNQITVNGAPVSFDQSWAMVDGELMVPLRKIVEAAGGSVQWSSETQTASVMMGTFTTTFTIGQDSGIHRKVGVFYKMEPTFQMDHTAILIGDRTLIPATALTDVLGFTIHPAPYPALQLEWDAANQN